MKNPKVSICIPTYKQPELFEKALNSVFIQTFKDYEVIVTDDSPDDSVELVVKKFSNHPELKYVKNEVRQGAPGNWNVGLDLARGEYIKVLHHDDWFTSEDSLGKYVKLLDENPNCDIAFSGTKNFDDKGKVTYEHRPNKDQLAKLSQDPIYICLGNVIGAPSATIHRNSIKHRFDVKLKWLVDIELYAQILLDNPKFAYSDELLISVLDSSPVRVTAESWGNKQVEVFEFLYLYKKITSKLGLNYKLFKHLWHLLERFSVYSREEIISFGFEEPFPREIYLLLSYQKILIIIIKIINFIRRLFSIERWARIILLETSFTLAKLLKTKK